MGRKKLIRRIIMQSLVLGTIAFLVACADGGGTGSVPSSSTQPVPSAPQSLPLPPPPPPPPPPQAHPYTTTFPLTENPILENGAWVNGGTTGLDWSNVQTAAGRAFGTQSGTDACPICYNDSTAILAGPWNPDQSVQATVFLTNPLTGGACCQEVELRLRTQISSNMITGYEINWKATSDGSQYCQIVKWNGALGDFTFVNPDAGNMCPGLINGAVISASITGDRITVQQNGVTIATATDSTFTSGSPGIGFFQTSQPGTDNTFGFTSVTASD